MLTYKLKIKNDINVTDYCKYFTGLYHELFFHFEESEDKIFQEKLRLKYDVDSWIYQSCKTEVKVKLKQIETANNKKRVELKELLAIKEFNSKRHKYKVLQKISYLSRNIGKDIIFGGKALLRKITLLSNPIKSSKQKHKRINKRILKRTKNKFKKNRLMPISIIGEMLRYGNRKFDFDFINRKLVFKPKNGIKIDIEFNCQKNIHDILCKLQQQIGGQAISVKLNNDYVWITFDEEKLMGFEFNEKDYFKELKTIDKNDKDSRKECYRKYIQEQEQRKSFGKILCRFLAFDLNPEYIGFVIVDKINDFDYKVIYKGCISLQNLNTKLRLSSTDKVQIKQNNKRIFELSCAWKYIFDLAKHYKVANIVMEELEFKQKSINDNATEANRKTKNIWHRTKTINLITKYCNTIGLKLIEVNACYSSFIGNIKHRLFDPVSACLEIARRGITKYIKGSFYPPLDKSDLDTMKHIFGLDVLNNTVDNWVQAYKLFVTSKLRYRWELQNCNFLENNLLSFKSNMKIYTFNTF